MALDDQEEGSGTEGRGQATAKARPAKARERAVEQKGEAGQPTKKARAYDVYSETVSRTWTRDTDDCYEEWSKGSTYKIVWKEEKADDAGREKSTNDIVIQI